MISSPNVVAEWRQSRSLQRAPKKISLETKSVKVYNIPHEAKSSYLGINLHASHAFFSLSVPQFQNKIAFVKKWCVKRGLVVSGAAASTERWGDSPQRVPGNYHRRSQSGGSVQVSLFSSHFAMFCPRLPSRSRASAVCRAASPRGGHGNFGDRESRRPRRHWGSKGV